MTGNSREVGTVLTLRTLSERDERAGLRIPGHGASTFWPPRTVTAVRTSPRATKLAATGAAWAGATAETAPKSVAASRARETGRVLFQRLRATGTGRAVLPRPSIDAPKRRRGCAAGQAP